MCSGLFSFFITLKPRYTKSMSLTYEPVSEPLRLCSGRSQLVAEGTCSHRFVWSSAFGSSLPFFFFFFFTLVSGPRRSLSLKLLAIVLGPFCSEALGCGHPGGNPGANLKSISHRCHPILVAFAWELTKETIVLPLGCLQGGKRPRGHIDQCCYV